MPAEVWVNIQDQALGDADLPGLAAYSGALLICAWPDATAQTLARLDRARCPVKLWRWVSDPRGWPGWPADFIRRGQWTTLANEPDLERWPAWYADACEAWTYAGGKLVEPAWHDDEARTSAPSGVQHHAVSWHCYAGDFANRAAVLARANGRPVYGTEYGRPHAQQQCLIDLAAAGVSEPTALFAYPIWQGNASAGYDLRGVALTPPPPPKGPTMPVPAPILRLPQQPGSLDCWIKCIEEFFLRYGHVLTDDLVFAAAKGRPRPAGGEAATFAEVKQGIAAIAQELGVTVQMADFDDPATVMAALHDPNTANPWTVIAGVKESDLQGVSQSYGHFLILDHEDAQGNITVTDSYQETDGSSGVYPKAAVEKAMVDSWEIAIDAIGAKIVA